MLSFLLFHKLEYKQIKGISIPSRFDTSITTELLLQEDEKTEASFLAP